MANYPLRNNPTLYFSGKSGETASNADLATSWHVMAFILIHGNLSSGPGLPSCSLIADFFSITMCFLESVNAFRMVHGGILRINGGFLRRWLPQKTAAFSGSKVAYRLGLRSRV
jgi:hypothetical protein